MFGRKINHLLEDIALGLNANIKVGAVESGNEGILGAHLQRLLDIVLHARRGGGGERGTNRVRIALAQRD